jgi:hypothetical protein
MTPDELRLAAHGILEAVAREYPAEASEVAAVLLVEILGMGLHGAGDEVAVGAFVQAVNGRLVEIASHTGATRSWKLIAVDAADDQEARLG